MARRTDRAQFVSRFAVPPRTAVRPRTAVLALALFAGAALTACGGGSDDDAATAATAAAAASPASGDADKTEGAVSDDPFCQQVAAASEKFGLNSGAATGINDAMSQLPEAAKLLEEASADAPTEIKPDLEVLSATLAEVAPVLTKVAELSAAAQTDPTKAAELQAVSGELSQKMAAIADPKFTAAIENLNTYTKEHCGIEFS